VDSSNALHRWWNISRKNYLNLLAQAAEKSNVNIILDAKLIEIDIENVRAVCQDGRGFSADVIVGADGMPLVLAAVCQTMTELRRYRFND
jgi:flavin-dependent dehydrogenase